jgi:hypothetical protein
MSDPVNPLIIPRAAFPTGSISPSNLSDVPSPSNFQESEELDNLVGRVSTNTEFGFKNAAAGYRKLTAIIAVALFICLFIPGVNVAVIAKAALIAAAVALFITLALGANYFKQEEDQVYAREKANIVFFECLKTLIAPLVCIYDLYKERQRRLTENVDFRIFGTAPIDEEEHAVLPDQ